jgi:hypothetical protein
MTVIGNVLGSATATSLGTAPVSSVYVGSNSDTPCIFELGGTGDISYTSLVAHGNYDTVTAGIKWSDTIATRTLPASLYRMAKPAWWPAANPWPWVGSDLTPMVGTLPARARSDSLAP